MKAPLAGAALLGCLLLTGCGTDAQPTPATTAPAAPVPVRTLYVQAPLSGPAADEGRAMVDAVRLVVDQAGGLSGRRRIVVRPLDDGGTTTATDPARCAANAATAADDPRALAVIGTYELACTASAMTVLEPAGLWLISPLNAVETLPGALRLAPTRSDQGGAAAQFAQALDATRIAVVSRRPSAAASFADGLSAGAHANGVGPLAQLDASVVTTRDLVTQLLAQRIQVVALAGAPGAWSTNLLRALMLLPEATRPAVVAPQAFDTLAFLTGAGAAAEGVRVISRLVPAEQLGSNARSFARVYADLHGEPPPVAVYAADAADAALRAAATGGSSRTTMARALAALPAHDGLLGRWAATPGGGITPRRLAVLVVDAGAFRVERVVSVGDPLPSSGQLK